MSKRGQVPTGPRARSPGDEAVQAVEALDWEDPSQGALDQCPVWEMGPSTMLEVADGGAANASFHHMPRFGPLL